MRLLRRGRRWIARGLAGQPFGLVAIARLNMKWFSGRVELLQGIRELSQVDYFVLACPGGIGIIRLEVVELREDLFRRLL